MYMARHELRYILMPEDQGGGNVYIKIEINYIHYLKREADEIPIF